MVAVESSAFWGWASDATGAPMAKPADIVDWAAGYFGLNRAQRKSRVDYLMQRFELTPHLKKSFRELSGGLKRRAVVSSRDWSGRSIR